MYIANLPIDEKYLAAYLHNIPDVPAPINMTLLASFIKSQRVFSFLSNSLLSNFLKKSIIIELSLFTLLFSFCSVSIFNFTLNSEYPSQLTFLQNLNIVVVDTCASSANSLILI